MNYTICSKITIFSLLNYKSDTLGRSHSSGTLCISYHGFHPFVITGSESVRLIVLDPHHTAGNVRDRLQHAWACPPKLKIINEHHYIEAPHGCFPYGGSFSPISCMEQWHIGMTLTKDIFFKFEVNFLSHKPLTQLRIIFHCYLSRGGVFETRSHVDRFRQLLFWRYLRD